MNSFLLFAALALLACAGQLALTTRSPPILTPSLPETAFVGQFYTCQFRVEGLDSPIFDFQGLPPCFIGSKAGLVTGLPLAVGSYPFTVAYGARDLEFHQEIVIRVSSSLPMASEAQLLSELQKSLAIQCEQYSFVFMVGVRVVLNLSASAGSPPYTWSYLRLPIQLTGDRNGFISGYFEQQGYYSFGVSLSDSRGNSTDAFFLLNIQPFTFFNSYNGYHRIVDVPNRNPILSVTYDQVTSLQQNVTAALYFTIKRASTARETVAEARRTLADTDSLMNSATKQIKGIEVIMNRIASLRIAAFKTLNAAENRVSQAKGKLALTEQALLQAKSRSQVSQKILTLAQNGLKQSNESFHKSSQDFISAQRASSQTVYNLHAITLQRDDYQNAVNLTFSELSLLKQFTQNATIQASLTDSQTATLSNARDLANIQNDRAQISLKSADLRVEQAKQTLLKTIQEASHLKSQLQAAKNGVGSAKMALVQAMNRLYVTQAAKEQADKTSLIASIQQSSDNIQLPFAGCDPSNYPRIWGSAQILKKTVGRMQLSSGQRLLLGKCSSGTAEVGDLISFEGYLREGAIHVISMGPTSSFYQQH